jgi:hypothetical protein
MKKSIGTSAFLGAMCIAVTPIAPAYAANWVYVTENEKNAVYYYDSDTIRGSGNQVTAWVKVDHSRDKTVKAREALTRYRFDCADRTWTLLSTTDYYPNGKTETFTWETYEQKEIAVVPDSVMEGVLEAVCP